MRRAIACLALFLTGCTTTLVITKVDPNRPESHVGIPHPLLYSRYETRLRWQVINCTGSLDVKVGVELDAPAAVPDGDNLFVIDPASLSSVFKTSEVLVEFLPSGAPVSLNAKAEDRGLQVIAGIATLGAGLVKLGAVPGAPRGPEGKGVQVCADETAQALKDLPARNQAVAEARSLVDAGVSGVKSPTGATARGIEDLGRAKARLEDALKAQARTLEALTFEQNEVWPPNGTTTTGRFELPLEVFQRWANDKVDPHDRDKAVVHLLLRGRDAAGWTPATEGAVRTDLGIPIRQGVEGEILACARQPCDSGGALLAKRVDRILQLGAVYYLPCVSRKFSSVSCTYRLDDSGRLKSMGSALTNAAGETVTTALNQALTQITEAKQAHLAAGVKQLEAETAYLKAKAERDAASDALAHATLDAGATAAFKAQAERLDAQRALIEAELALAAAQAKAAGQP
jgi:hypothetical protein